MRTAPARRAATYADLEALPPHLVGEIVDGELFASPRPASAHALASSEMGTDLGSAFSRGRGGPGGWWIVDEPELHLGADVVVPDLAGWRRSRLPRWPDTAALDLAPDWICEILSPSTHRLDRIAKMPIYAREGVGHAWLVDPRAETVEVFRNEGGRWVLIQVAAGEALLQAEPFDAVAFEMGPWWGHVEE